MNTLCGILMFVVFLCLVHSLKGKSIVISACRVQYKILIRYFKITSKCKKLKDKF